MRFFDKWWEHVWLRHVHIVAPLAPLMIALIVCAVRPSGYHWE
jgi:hypothetical protein